MNGPTGLMIGAARGVVRSMHCNPDFPAGIFSILRPFVFVSKRAQTKNLIFEQI